MPLPDPFGFVFDFFEKKEEPTKNPKNAEEENKRPPFVINTLTDSHEQLRTHKPGDIVYDERRQKWYRVKKSTLPGYLTYGPKNIGDPDDTFLRKIEKNVLLPDMMAKKIEKVDCRTDFMEFIRCMRREGEYESVQSCQPFFDKFYGCKLEKFRDPEFRERVTQEFLRDRSEYRKTGLSRNEREMEKYLKWKEDMLKEKLRQQGKEAPD